MYANMTEANVLTTPATSSHIVQVCQNVTAQAETVTNYINEGLLSGEAVIVIARPVLRKAVISRMEALGLDSQAIRNEGRIKFLDAEFLLFGFLIDGELNERAFNELIGIPIQSLQLKYGKVRAFGEMVDVLWKDGLQNTALRLEDLWNNLSQEQGFLLLCTYLIDSLDSNAYEDSLERICKCHSQVEPAEKYDLSENADEGLLNVFEAAWNSMLDKLTESEEIATQLPANQTTLLN